MIDERNRLLDLETRLGLMIDHIRTLQHLLETNDIPYPRLGQQEEESVQPDPEQR